MTAGVAPALAVVEAWLDGRRPTVALVLGSGLGGLVDRLANAERLAYGRLPGFPGSTLPGHAGELLIGVLGGVAVICQSGRFHAYEGHAQATVTLPSRLFAALGIRQVILANAAGGIRRSFAPGTLMCIADQVNLTWANPLVGALVPGDTRFPDMSAPFDPELITLAHAMAGAGGIALEDGVYCGVMGPSYETPAEIRMLERLGADAVGMSTIAEVITLRAQGLRCLGLSIITNRAAGLSLTPLSHEDVMTTADAAGEALGRLVEGVVAGLHAREAGTL
ncbi:MAG: purine-nucleoside phosphorylase [Gemmatimonadota bacterium]|nr:purine-nucleoside phosphorylase [Gemmatimonadota bacterium]